MFEATVLLLLACLLSSLLLLNAINGLVEVKHCGGRREGTHTLTRLKESKAQSFPLFPSSARLHPPIHLFTCVLGDQSPLTDVRSVRDDQPLLPAF